eukprot:2446992-Rhodomonas_salina.1
MAPYMGAKLTKMATMTPFMEATLTKTGAMPGLYQAPLADSLARVPGEHACGFVKHGELS